MNDDVSPLFIRWSLVHWAALGAVALAAAILLWGGRRLRMEKRILVGKVLGAVFLLTFLAETFGRIVQEHWEPWQDRLPLHFCSLMTLVCFIALWYRRPWACAAAYFGVLTASIQGLITPMLYEGFPSAAFFAFFIGHGLLFISALYLPLVLEWRARPWDDVKTLLLCDAYLLLIIPVNIWLRTNYGFTRYAPEGSVLEYFGPAPWYLLTLQIPALAVLRLLYLTVRPRKKKREEETASVEKLPGQ